MEIESVNGNNKNKATLYKGRMRFFSGKTKHVLLLLSAVLILTCILAIPLASCQIQPIALNTQTNGVNSGDVSFKENPIMALSGTTNGGISLVGNMTTIGNTSLNGLLNVSKFDKIVLGPLTSNGTQNITADLIEIDKPCYVGDTITLTGTPANPSIVGIFGNIYIGDQYRDREVFMNMTGFYQYVYSYGTGYIGDSGSQGDLPLNTKDAIKVHQGQLEIHSPMLGELLSSDITITSTNCRIVANILGLGLLSVNVNLKPYNGWANISQMKEDNKLIAWLGLIPIDLGLFIGDVQGATYLQWDAPVIFEAKGPWFALDSGIIRMTDTYVQMKSNGTMTYRFLDSSSNAGFRITPSAHYPKAVMNASTLQQVINGRGFTYLTNGSTTLTGANIKQQNQIVNGTLTFQGNMLQEGTITVQGNIGISGYNYMQGNIKIRDPLLSLNGVMVTDGDMSITSGAIKIPSGKMVMNDTGSYITGDTITVTGIVDFNGDAIITGNIGISGHNYMEGNVNVAQLSLNGVMVTDGDMSITNGTIGITDGHMAMNDMGSFITSTGNTITVTGTVNFNGDAVITGDIGISGHNYMQGNIKIRDPLLNLDGVMVTDGDMSITSGEISIPSGSMVMDDTGSYITGDTITVTGDVDFNGEATITGDIGISGHNYMQGNIKIRDPLLSLNGVMVTDGDMSITSGAISIQTGHMVMNVTGSYITGDTITVTGIVDFNGDATITGDIGISGYNYMQGKVNVAQLSLDGVMVTDGDLGITSGEISILNGHMVMNDFGSFITGNTITVTGTIESSGDATITGDIELSGYNYMLGLISIEGYLNINNGLTEGMLTLNIDGTMETNGSMTITNGEINIPDGHMVMNPTGSFITGNTIMVTGDQIVSLGTTEVTGDITIQGDIGISGYNYMQGNVYVAQLILDGVMATNGDMSITGGAISITNGHMVMNETGSYITSTGNTITVTGIVSFNGDATITGDIELSGYNYMEGNVNVGQLGLDGVMVTDGDMSITSGEISILSGSMDLNSTGSFIIGDTITVTGTINFNGDATITGDIELSGYNYMEGLITVQGDLNINNGLTNGEITLTIASTMETTGTMTITNGEISIPGVTMVMNSTDSFIIADTISVTGDQIASQGTTEVNGDITMTGDIGISGHSYMEGLISIEGYLNMNNGLTTGTLTLSIDGTMETTGSMTITNGEINIPNGQIVMNGTGSFIIGDTITVTGDQINSVGTTEVNGDITMQGDYFEIGGGSYI